MECNKVDVSSHQGSKSLTDLKNNRAKVGSREGIYFGETSRSLFERVQEHHKDAEDFSAGSHIIKHWMTDHPDMVEKPHFKFSIIGIFKDCLSRQVAEAMRILHTTDKILNSKNEYLDNNIPRICVDESKLDRRKREKAEYEAELKEERELEDFKMKHRKVPKRPRDATSPQGELERWLEPGAKKKRIDEVLEEQLIDSDFFLNEWMDRNEGICQRVGDLREKIRIGNLRALRLMECCEIDRILDDLSIWWND